jgi:hypothetical protein
MLGLSTEAESVLSYFKKKVSASPQGKMNTSTRDSTSANLKHIGTQIKLGIEAVL